MIINPGNKQQGHPSTYGIQVPTENHVPLTGGSSDPPPAAAGYTPTQEKSSNVLFFWGVEHQDGAQKIKQ